MPNALLKIPINLTEAGDDLVLHAAMPGAEPENIVITFTDKTIIVHSSMRAMLASDKKPLKQEWHIGEYHREVRLPFPIMSQHTNVTYDNGVLTVSMPRGEKTLPREIRVKKIRGARGQTRGHQGRGSSHTGLDQEL